jgi:hypothetical protein
MPAKIVRHRSGKGWVRIGWPTAAQAREDSLKYNHVVSVTSVNHRSEQRNQKPEEQEGEDPESHE